MENKKQEIDFQDISNFLEGRNPEQYLVNVELDKYSADATLVFSVPKEKREEAIVGYKDHYWLSETKLVARDDYKPFLWMTQEAGKIISERLGGKDQRIWKMKNAGIDIKSLRTTNNEGFEPEKVKNGYKYLLYATKPMPYQDLVNFLSKIKINIYGEEYRGMFMACSPIEQYLIQTKKRLFKGMDDYEDLHKLTFDLETLGLDPKLYEIFLIGVKDNRGFEEIVPIQLGNRESEYKAIKRFFEIIDELKPDLINGYNSENFDFDFIVNRCQICGSDITHVAKTLIPKAEFRRQENASVKFGGETEKYTQTIMFGYNIIDTYHAVRRAKAIDSSIERTGLKYITKFCEFDKPNRVYIDGDKIGKYWSDTDDFAFNDTNGHYYKISAEKPLKDGFTVVKGSYIVERYLMDDLWETQMVDTRFNQANFLINKILPTTYPKACTMGTSGIWKLIMMAWSYENNLAIPQLEEKEDFTGGLSRLMRLGYVENVVKFDYTSLYPTIELAHEIKTEKDISNAMSGFLKYVLDERIRYKNLKKKHTKESERLEKEINECSNIEKIKELTKEFEHHKNQESVNDKKQLPLKILANSYFGSFGSPHLFPWGDLDCAEETTCRGRQYLRLMIEFFNKRGFTPIVGDTDGFNFQFPSEVTYEYTSNGKHFSNTSGKKYTGINGVVSEFNDNYMLEPMGLTIDEIVEKTVNFSKKNYVDKFYPDKKHPEGKMKKVGNTVKSSSLAIYQQEFFDKGLRMLCEGKGYEFINAYYDYIDDIYNYRIPLRKIASKSNIKQSLEDYVEYCKGTTKAGNLNSRQAHMELALKNNLIVNLGDTIYHYNTGKQKSHGDVKFDKKTNEILIRCELLDHNIVENEIDEFGEYNTSMYISKFNNRMEALLICFHPDIRYDILIDNPKDRKQFTESQCELVSGIPSTKVKSQMKQTTYEEMMTPDDKEIKFWLRVNQRPNHEFVFVKPWDELVADYKVRENQRIENEKYEEKKFLIQHLIEDKKKNNKKHQIKVPSRIKIQFLLQDDFFHSRTYGDKLMSFEDYQAFYELELDEWVSYIQDNNETGLYEAYCKMVTLRDEDIRKEKEVFLKLIITEPEKTRRLIKKKKFHKDFKKYFEYNEETGDITSLRYEVKIASVDDYLLFFNGDEPGEYLKEDNDTGLFEILEDLISQDEENENGNSDYDDGSESESITNPDED